MDRRIKLAILTLIFVGFGLYLFNFNNPLFWDDDDWIVRNPAVHNLSWENIKFIFSRDTLAGIGLTSNYYRPFLFLTFLVNYLVSGIEPFFYHLTSNTIHIFNSVLVFILLEKLFSKWRPAFLASLLFLIHPLQTEAVTYISGRGDPLSVMFMLLTILAFTNNKKWWAILAAILGILTRETAFLLPVYLTIFLMAFKYRGRFIISLKKSIFDAWPFYAISLIYGILRLTVLNFQNTLNFYQQANAYTEHLSYRIYTFFHVLVVYFKLIFVPTGLHMERDVAVNVSLFQWPVWVGALSILLSLFLLYKMYKKESLDFRIWFFGIGFFFVNLIPTSGIFPINALIYEHWLYFSLFGFFAILAWYLDVFLENLRKYSIVYFKGCMILIALYIGFFGWQTIQRNIIWGKTAEFYEEILYYEPENVRVLNNLANYYSNHGKLEKSEELLWRAIDINDIQPAPYYNLGNILRDRKEYAGALELYKKAIEIDKNFPYAYTNIAAIYAQQGNLSEAIEYLEKLRKIQPKNYEVYYNLGQIYEFAGQKSRALEFFNLGLSLIGDPVVREKFLIKINGLK